VRVFVAGIHPATPLRHEFPSFDMDWRALMGDKARSTLSGWHAPQPRRSGRCGRPCRRQGKTVGSFAL
jgi:hypothetical protein